MPVFKAYLKIIRKYLPSLLIYFGMFIAISVIISSLTGSQTTQVFNATMVKIAFISDDSDNALVSGLKSYLANNAQLVQVADTKESLQDALFYGKVSYILRVPSGFEESFMSGADTVTLAKTTQAMSTSSVSIDMLVNKYLNVVRLYHKSLPNLSEQEIVTKTLQNLDESVRIDMASSAGHQKTAGLADYFQYAAYAILGTLIMGITTVTMAFNDGEIRKRNACSPLRPLRLSLSLFLGNAVFALAVWAALCALSLGLFGGFTLDSGAVLLCLNALVFTIVCLTIGFLGGKFIKSPTAQAAFTNIVSLSICFISGVFVPQELLSGTVLKIASLTPGYWYVSAVNTIRSLSSFDLTRIRPILSDMLIQLGFAAALLIVALTVAKQQQRSLES
ncbi:ABC transporter permease [Oscillospiraceae bacterium CM]|nr:ABC transporter permease [Oscillospiraceae bacterium CM]